LLQARGERVQARVAFERAVRVGGAHGRDAVALLGLAELDLEEGRMAALTLVRRLLQRFAGRAPEHHLTALLLCLIDEPERVEEAAEVAERHGVTAGHTRSLDLAIRLRRAADRPVEALERLRAVLAQQ